jgi:hypothetical protein
MAIKPTKISAPPERKAAPASDASPGKDPTPVKRSGDQRFAGLRKPRSAAAADAPPTAARRASPGRAPLADAAQRLAALPHKPLNDVAAVRLLGHYPPHVVESAADVALRGLRALQNALKKGSAG